MSREELEYRITSLTSELHEAYETCYDEEAIDLITADLVSAETDLYEFDKLEKQNESE